MAAWPKVLPEMADMPMLEHVTANLNIPTSEAVRSTCQVLLSDSLCSYVIAAEYNVSNYRDNIWLPVLWVLCAL